MKDQIITVLKSSLTAIISFSKEHPKLSLFLFGTIVGLFIAFIF